MRRSQAAPVARTAAAVAVIVLAAAAAPSAQTRRVALDALASADAAPGSDVPRYAGVWFDVFGVLRIVDGLDLIARPIVNRRLIDGTWQTQMYQLGARYERPGRVGIRLEGGRIPSPIGLAILENRPDLNPVVSQHSAYYLPLPRGDPEIPRAFLIGAANRLGAQATASARKWDARVAVIDGSPIRGSPSSGTARPRLSNAVVGAGIKPMIGLRIGAALASGGYVAASELPPAAPATRDATVAQVEIEWSFAYTRLAGELVHSSLETARADAVAAGGWVEITQTLTPRVFLAARADSQRFTYQRPSQDFVQERYQRYEAVLGFRVTPDLTLRGGYMVRNGYVVSHWDDHLMLSVVWQRRIL